MSDFNFSLHSLFCLVPLSTIRVAFFPTGGEKDGRIKDQALNHYKYYCFACISHLIQNFLHCVYTSLRFISIIQFICDERDKLLSMNLNCENNILQCRIKLDHFSKLHIDGNFLTAFYSSSFVIEKNGERNISVIGFELCPAKIDVIFLAT